ncbi:MAG: hypothetical protein HXM78_00645 [Neisseria lactamica]|nr:hypothetical protein [uncultured Neisseria sp.]MBF1278957.1 hypothetical protein [Neisseria lactamica]
MQLIVHDHAEEDLNRLFESKEEAVGYIDSVIALIDDTPALFDKLFSEKNCRDYDQPIGLLGMECKRVAVLWRADIRVMRLRLDEESALSLRILYCVRNEMQPNRTFIRKIYILAVADKSEGFDYQPDHPIMRRIQNDYAKIEY